MMWTHKRAKLGAVMIWRHKQVALILIGGITGRWLCGRCKALEIKFIGITLAMNLGHNVLVIVVSVNKRLGELALRIRGCLCGKVKQKLLCRTENK